MRAAIIAKKRQRRRDDHPSPYSEEQRLELFPQGMKPPDLEERILAMQKRAKAGLPLEGGAAGRDERD